MKKKTLLLRILYLIWAVAVVLLYMKLFVLPKTLKFFKTNGSFLVRFYSYR